jgi:hypothetical protein
MNDSAKTHRTAPDAAARGGGAMSSPWRPKSEFPSAQHEVHQ